MSSEDIVIGICFLAIPLIIWLIPRTRQMTGTWITSLKTVPLGCLTALLVPTIIGNVLWWLHDNYELFKVRHLRGDALFFSKMFLGLVLGILLIVCLSRFIWRKNSSAEKRSWKPFIMIFVLVGFFGLIVSFAYTLAASAISKENYHGDWLSVPLPEENGTRIAFEQRGLSLFLAEYDYRLRFKQNNEVKYRNLLRNTGGKTCFNIYRLKDGRLLFVDKNSDYIVDPEKAEAWLVFPDREKSYIALLPQDKFEGWGRSGIMRVEFGSHQAEVRPLTNELDGKIYYGCITDDFYTAAEKPEQTFGMMRN